MIKALKATPLGGRAGHTSVHAAAFHAATGTLVLAGDAARSGGEAGAGSIISVSAWRLEISGNGGDCKAQLMGAYVGPLQAPGASGVDSAPASLVRTGLGRWCLAVSPLGEQAALCVPPAGGGLLLLSLPQCSRVQLGLQAAPGLAACAATAVSACWWSSEAVLALADGRGRVALAQLPGLGADLLLPGPGPEDPESSEDGDGAAQHERGVIFAPGTVVAAKVGGPGPRGLLMLEPAATGGSVGDRRVGAAPAGAGSGQTSLRLLLLAERAAQEMMQLHVRHQRWGAALRLAAAEGLDADAVYAARWAASALDGGGEAVAANLEHVRDRRWVVGQCLTRLAADAAGQRLLLRYGLAESEAQERRAQSEADGGAPWWWWRLARLRLLRHLDRLEVLLAAQGGAYDAAAYAAFRDLPLAAAAASWAALGGVGPLTALTAAYPAALSPLAPGPLLLGILSRLPETLSPRLYGTLLPRADNTDACAARTPARAADWAEAPEQLAALQAALTAAVREAGDPGLLVKEAEEAPGGGPLPGCVDADLTDATWQALAPAPVRLSAAVVCEWYCERALQLDEATGQMQASLTLLELGWERGGRSPRLAQLLGAARALAGVMTAVSTARQCTSSALAASVHSRHGHPRPPPPSVWLLGLRGFLGLPGGEQLRLLLGGSSEDSLRRDVKERVLPFLRGPGVSAAEAAALAGALLGEELQRRPGWAAALCEAEADTMAASASASGLLFSNAEHLIKALHRALMDCHHTDEWPALQRAVAAAERALVAERRQVAGTQASASHDMELQLAEAEAALSRLAGTVTAAELLAAHGLPLTVRHVSSCRESAQEAARCVRQVLGRVQRSGACQPDAQWAALWRDLAAVRAAAFTCLAPEQVLSELCRCMLHCGRTDLANGYLRGGAPRVPLEAAASKASGTLGSSDSEPYLEAIDGERGEHLVAVVSLDEEAADALLASVAAELLAAANDPWDSSAQLAAACLALAGDDCKAAQGLRRLMAALELLPDFGIELLPAQVLQMTDRFEVVRLAVAAQEQAQVEERRGSIAAGLAPGLVAVLTGVGKAAAGQVGAKGLGAAALGGRNSRRRAAVQAAGRAAAAGGRAAAALAGGLLAVAGRVAPNVAGRVAGIVGAAAMGEDGPEEVLAGAGVGPTAGSAHVSVGRLLELAELLGLTSTADEMRVRELAARSALRCGDLETAQHLALGLEAAAYTPVWSLCADLGSHKQLPGGDHVRRRLLSYAALHCPPARMPLLLEQLRDVEHRVDPQAQQLEPAAAGSGRAAAAHVDTESHLRQAVIATPQAGPGGASAGFSATAGLPSLGDILLALAVLQPTVAERGGTADPESQKRLQLLSGLAAAHGGSDGHAAPYAQVQRVLTLQCFCNCLTAAAEGGDCGTPERLLLLLQRSLSSLLEQVRRTSTCRDTVAAAAAVKASGAESALAAAADSRAVRRAVPGVDAGQFATGDVAYRREAILSQASLAGAAEAEALVGSVPSGSSPGSASGPPSPTSGASASHPAALDLGDVLSLPSPVEVLADTATSARGAELLAAAGRLAAVYGVEAWELRLAFTTSLLTSAPAATPELRVAISRAAAPLLKSEQPTTALLRQLTSTVYPALPPTSGPHLAAWMALLMEGVGAAAQLGTSLGELDATTVSALTAAACPALDKLRELLERAAGALKGLALTTLLAPLLGAVLQPLGLELQAPAGSAGRSMIPEAAVAALFAYVKPANIPQAVKLVAALHKLLGPLARKALVPQLQPALDALPASLPFLCLCVKAVSMKAPRRSSGDSGTAGAPQQQQRDMAAAWGHIAEHVVRLPPPQLAAWLAFALLPGSGPGPGYCCPLPLSVTGCVLQPVPMPRPVQTEVLDVCMPLLAAAEGAATGALPGMAEPLPQLRELHRRLRLLRAARQYLEAVSGNMLGEEQSEAWLHRLDSDLFPGAPGSRSDAAAAADLADCGRVQSALAHLAASGCPFALLVLVAAVVEGTVNGGRLAAEAVQQALKAALERLHAAVGHPDVASHVEGLDQLRGVVRCLDVQPAMLAAAAAGMGPPVAPLENELTLQLEMLREEVWLQLQQATEQQESAGETAGAGAVAGVAEQVSAATRAVVPALLRLQAQLGGEVWSDWGGDGASAGSSVGGAEKLRQRVLLTRTRALLANLPPLRQAGLPDAGSDWVSGVSVRPEDVESCNAAESLFTRLLGATAGSDMQSALPQPQSREWLQLLSRLLSDVWQGGQVWAEQSPSQEGRAGAAANVSLLHACWRDLALAHLRSGHILEAVRILDSPQLQPEGTASRMLLLASADVDELLHQAASGQGGIQHAPNSGCSPGPWARWVLGMSSPYSLHQQQVLEELQQKTDARHMPPPTELEALLLLALLARGGHAAWLASQDARCMSSQLLRCLPAAAQLHVFGLDCSTVARGAVVPCVAALMAQQGKDGLAAGLAARWLRLHPSLAAAGGSGAVLETYLKKVVAEAALPGRPAAHGEDAFTAADVERAGWPNSVVWSVREREHISRTALQQLALRMQQLPTRSAVMAAHVPE